MKMKLPIIILTLLAITPIIQAATDSFTVSVDVINDTKSLERIYNTTDLNMIKEQTFTELKENNPIEKTAVFTINATKIINETKEFSIEFNERCGHITSYDIVTPKTCNETSKTYYINNKTLKEEYTEIITYYECDEPISKMTAYQDYKITNVKINPEWCQIGNTYYTYAIDWIPKLKIGENTLYYNNWAWWNGTGGTITTIIDEDGLNHTVHTFTSNGTFNFTGNTNAKILLVAGGGGGGIDEDGYSGGGGGAGGLIYNASYPLTTGTYNITVGSGGAGVLMAASVSNNGTNTIFGIYTAIGGGGGGNSYTPTVPYGYNGGSGGGMGACQASGPGNGTPGQGNKGGLGKLACTNPDLVSGGGGGAGSNGYNYVGTTAGKGGAGLNYSINGTNTNYSCGGGGGTYQGTPGAAGCPGAGTGGRSTPALLAGNATCYGCGGGAGGGTKSGNGMQGIVIISYLTPLIDIGNITNLQNTSSTDQSILLNWTMGGNSSETMIYKNNAWITNTSNNYYNSTGLTNNTCYNYTLTPINGTYKGNNATITACTKQTEFPDFTTKIYKFYTAIIKTVGIMFNNNPTTPTCIEAYESLIIYNYTSHKHQACNSTAWNDLY